LKYRVSVRGRAFTTAAIAGSTVGAVVATGAVVAAGAVVAVAAAALVAVAAAVATGAEVAVGATVGGTAVGGTVVGTGTEVGTTAGVAGAQAASIAPAEARVVSCKNSRREIRDLLIMFLLKIFVANRLKTNDVYG
jgi:hypothetical protein